MSFASPTPNLPMVPNFTRCPRPFSSWQCPTDMLSLLHNSLSFSDFLSSCSDLLSPHSTHSVLLALPWTCQACSHTRAFTVTPSAWDSLPEILHEQLLTSFQSLLRGRHLREASPWPPYLKLQLTSCPWPTTLLALPALCLSPKHLSPSGLLYDLLI